MFCASRASIFGASWSYCAHQRLYRCCRAYGRATASGQMQHAPSSPHASDRHAADAANHRPCDIESHLSKEGRARNLSSLSKFIFSFSEIPDIVSLHGGLPNASVFPFKSMKVELEDGTWLDMSEKDKVCPRQMRAIQQSLASIQSGSQLQATSSSIMHNSDSPQRATHKLCLIPCMT